jgi:serine/threonine protein kinase
MDLAKVIHCDLKPENLLITPESASLLSPHWDVNSLDSTNESGTHLAPIGLKIIDLGSACYDGNGMYSYIQSRFYRAPEVLLGLPYDSAIDMWSLGCIVAEMFLGLPIFPGVSEYNQLCRITEMLGPTPDVMLESGKYTSKFYKRNKYQSLNPKPGSSKFLLKTSQEYAAETKTEVPVSKKYFKHSRLRDIIMSYPFRKGTSPQVLAWEKQRRSALVHFVHLLLQLQPHKRLTPKQALAHPFMTGAPMPSVKTQDSTLPEANSHYIDEDGNYWTPPHDDAVADRALKFMRLNNSRIGAKQKERASMMSRVQDTSISLNIDEASPQAFDAKIQNSASLNSVGAGKSSRRQDKETTKAHAQGGVGAMSSSLPSYPILVPPPPPVLPGCDEYQLMDNSPPMAPPGFGFINGADSGHAFSFHQGFTQRHLLSVNKPVLGPNYSNDAFDVIATSDFTYALQRPDHHERVGTQPQQVQGYNWSQFPCEQPFQQSPKQSPRRHSASGTQQIIRRRANTDGNISGQLDGSQDITGTPVLFNPPANHQFENHPIWGSPMTSGHFGVQYHHQRQQQQQFLGAGGGGSPASSSFYPLNNYQSPSLPYGSAPQYPMWQYSQQYSQQFQYRQNHQQPTHQHLQQQQSPLMFPPPMHDFSELSIGNFPNSAESSSDYSKPHSGLHQQLQQPSGGEAPRNPPPN